MVTVQYYPQRDIVGTKVIIFKDKNLSLASDPIPVSETGKTPEYEQSQYLDLDEFQGMTGSGEHPCSHDKVNGNIVIHFGSSIIDGLGETKYSPMWTEKPHWFSKATKRSIQGSTLLSTINGVPSEEWVGMNLSYFSWHSCISGNIGVNNIDITIKEGLWSYGRRYENRSARHYVLSSEYWNAKDDAIHYTGFVETGNFPSDTSPDRFASAPCQFDSRESLDIICPLLDVEGAGDDLEHALNLMAVEGFKDAIATQYTRGELLLDHLSCTQVAMEAVGDVHVLDTNSIENAVQATDLTQAIPPLSSVFDLLRNADDPTQWVKSASKVYLWYKYAAKPTCSDIKSYLELARTTSLDTLQKLKGGSYRATKVETFGAWTTRVAAKVTLHPYAADAVSKAMNTLDNVGLLPTLARAWDMVPYSFVIDWVTNVGSCLGAIDTALFQNRYQIDNVVTSRKATRKGYLQGIHKLGANLTISCSGIDYSLYRRLVEPTIPVDPRVNLRGLTTTGHSVAGAALLVNSLS